MNQADRDLLREVSGFLAEHYRGPGVDDMRRRIDQRLNADDLDGRFARIREREAAAAPNPGFTFDDSGRRVDDDWDHDGDLIASLQGDLNRLAAATVPRALVEDLLAALIRTQLIDQKWTDAAVAAAVAEVRRHLDTTRTTTAWKEKR